MKKQHNLQKNRKLRNIPGVDTLLKNPRVRELIKKYNKPLVTYAIRKVLDTERKNLIEGDNKRNTADLIEDSIIIVKSIATPTLKPVINASGIVLHTNLGRAPIGHTVLKEIGSIGEGYSNLEFDLNTAKRSNRNNHIALLLRYITAAEETLVVNNNAAAVFLVLKTLAKGKEVIVSRGELIEIGGKFRLPDIMIDSGAKMVEVGTTNKTYLFDYENKINENTALLLKVHRSNFDISGFTEEVSIKDLAKLAHKHNLPLLYDIGSGLLSKPEGLPLKNEPDVRRSLKEGADLVTFSCDKMLGGPQAGIIAGKEELIKILGSSPLMRVLRVGKLTLAALTAVCRNYLDVNKIKQTNPIFKFLNRTEVDLKQLAKTLHNKINKLGIPSHILEWEGYCGGGTLPGQQIKSFAVEILPIGKSVKEKKRFSEKLYHMLLTYNPPVLGILTEAKVLFNVLTLFDKDISYLAESIGNAITTIKKDN